MLLWLDKAIANLINICEDCHQTIHKNNDKLTICKTSDGYAIISNQKNNNKQTVNNQIIC